MRITFVPLPEGAGSDGVAMPRGTQITARQKRWVVVPRSTKSNRLAMVGLPRDQLEVLTGERSLDIPQ